MVGDFDLLMQNLQINLLKSNIVKTISITSTALNVFYFFALCLAIWFVSFTRVRKSLILKGLLGLIGLGKYVRLIMFIYLLNDRVNIYNDLIESAFQNKVNKRKCLKCKYFSLKNNKINLKNINGINSTCNVHLLR